jgi:hypothetical protein
MIGFSKDNEQKLPLYVLRGAESKRAIFRFDQAERRFLTHAPRRSELAKLDLNIEEIELKLRSLIGLKLDGDAEKLPGHVAEKISEKLRALAKKDAAVEISRYEPLLARLEFADMRELQDVILAKTLWPFFQSQFANKETLGAKFGTLSELRNAIRHSRTVDDITLKEGEAAIIWFDRILKRSK